jgi:hypothetical protein
MKIFPEPLDPHRSLVSRSLTFLYKKNESIQVIDDSIIPRIFDKNNQYENYKCYFIYISVHTKKGDIKIFIICEEN